MKEEFEEAIMRKWCLSIENITNYAYTFEGKKLNVSEVASSLFFDFENNIMNVNGSLSLELFNSETFFLINKIENKDAISMNISNLSNTTGVFMRIKVSRNNLIFLGTLKSWYTIIPKSNCMSLNCFKQLYRFS